MLERIGIFKWSIAATVAAIAAAYFYGGFGAAATVAVLIALEGSISFDNAVVNATVLRRMSERWQRVFLTIGILIAVFGMRVLFPILIVAVATKLGIFEVANQALTNEQAYARNVEEAAPIIGGFGGAFLLMVSLSFLLDREREVHWLGPIDRGLSRAGRLSALPVAVVGIAIVAASQLVGGTAGHEVLLAGVIGIVVFLVVRGFADLLEETQIAKNGKATGTAGLAAFLYLEVLDASFSLDGVLGAFAITKDIILIALGLGVGAIYIRSLTVYLVRRQTLRQYRYLKHGAHWAIGALGVILLLEIRIHVPEWITGTIGLGLIAAAFASSVVYNRRSSDEEDRGEGGRGEGDGGEGDGGEGDDANGEDGSGD